MLRRKPGRPRKDHAIDLALMPMGGLRAVVERLMATHATNAQIVDYLAAQSGIRVSDDTLRNWRREWAAEAAQEAGA